ncbi:murein hydrolase activator EnvC family protein [Stakelama saccharophila]|uniref:Peptidoglycan DD-metalloendopeptidase family protein n=1 Tax=Stakelama saccharophila TaxID=3075605 RepID=A0ABZ0BBW4_9SPHN|nr:peptidoglycan DD-metalloendopeptidase family protein [Stakelama sp. W311]WNO53799.1 peptidoglycan DD-metalloendopeptidase family protein [Stakelama sp. W311]
MARRAILLLGVLGAALTGGAATILPAQSRSDVERERLREAKELSARADARADRLAKAAAAERDAAERARAERASVAARIDAARSDIAAGRARVALVSSRLRSARGRLAERRAPLTRLMAALQSMARRPALVSIAQPGSTRDIVHVRAMLGTLMPVIRARTADLRTDIADVARLRAQSALALASLRRGQQELEHQRMALLELEAEHRMRSKALAAHALHESDRAIALGERARDLVDRMDRLRDAAATEASLAPLPGPLPRPEGGPAPAARAASGAAPYVLPVAGKVVTGLGEVSQNGVRSRGLTLATAPGAAVRAPAAGVIRFAGPFESYGRIVLIAHEDGWTTLVTGLGATSRKRGAHVRQGEVIGRAPDGDEPKVTVELRRKGEPVDITGLLG